MNKGWITAAAILGALCITAAAYWNLFGGQLVWDDLLCLRDQGWLREGGAWQRLFAGDFCGWSNYFRPMAVALFIFESRNFGIDPVPLHAVSLCLHLANTLLVGLIARAWIADRGRAILAALAMLLYGLHPALVEPVAWISAQTELAVTFFMLLAIFLNLTLRQTAARSIAVTACFFFAACAKESAISLPLLLPVLDWLMLPPNATNAPLRTRLVLLLRRQWATYLGIALAGFAYLALRVWSLGYLLHAVDSGVHLSGFARLQEIAYSYLVYWRIMIWPMIGANPVHLVDERQFATLTANSVLLDVGALAIVTYGAFALWKGRVPGGLAVIVSVLLLPALHVVPVPFDESLYHERYAMAALAVAAAMLPGAIPRVAGMRDLRLCLGVTLAAWLVAGWFNIRATLPLWSNDVALWQWAVRANPGSVSAKENLLATYITAKDPRTHAFADALIADPASCPTCLLNVAYFAMSERDIARAAAALDKLQTDPTLAYDMRLRQAVAIARSRWLEMQGDSVAAENAYRVAAAVDPHEPLAQLQLALFLARAGRSDESREVEESALLLFSADQRAQRRKEFEEALAEQPIPVSATPN